MDTTNRSAGRPGRECSGCANSAQALPGAPLICVFQSAYRRVGEVRAERGACGPFARQWRPIPITP